MPDAAAPTNTASQAKPWWQSRTLWFNALCAALAAAELGLGALQTVLPGEPYAWLSFAIVVGNAVLRALTTQPLALRKAPGVAGLLQGADDV